MKLTLGLFDFRRDHNRRTPSRRSMILQRKKKNKEFNKKKKKQQQRQREKERKNSRHVVRLSRTSPHCIGDVY